MDRLTLDLRALVQEFSGLTVEDILARIAEPHPKRESQRRAMGWIRYSINHGRPHPSMVLGDIQVIEPLIRDLVRIGSEGAGLPPETLGRFKVNGPATPR